MRAGAAFDIHVKDTARNSQSRAELPKIYRKTGSVNVTRQALTENLGPSEADRKRARAFTSLPASATAAFRQQLRSGTEAAAAPHQAPQPPPAGGAAAAPGDGDLRAQIRAGAASRQMPPTPPASDAATQADFRKLIRAGAAPNPDPASQAASKVNDNTLSAAGGMAHHACTCLHRLAKRNY